MYNGVVNGTNCNGKPRCGWKASASEVARKTRNPIREIVENLKFEPNPDKDMIALSIGDPTIFGNLKPPKEAIAAVHKSLESYRHNGYAPSTGYIEARSAVANYASAHCNRKISPTDVILSSGCSGALELCVIALSGPDRNVLIPRPGFSIYRTLGEGIDTEFRYYDLQPEKGWEIDLEDLESKIDENTAAIVIINPSNPCGSVYSEQHLRDLLEVCARNYVPVIADEIYEHLVFPGETFTPLAALSEDVPILSCSGLAKRFLVPGWRIGWIVVHDRHGIFQVEIRKALQSLSQRIMGCNTIIQGALKSIFESTPQSFFDDLIDVLYSNAVMVHTVLKETPGLTPIMPKGAMYMMVGIEMDHFPNFDNALQFVRHLVEEQSVFCLPGECFNFPGYMRLVLTLPKNLLIEACERIVDFCTKYYKTRVINGCVCCGYDLSITD